MNQCMGCQAGWPTEHNERTGHLLHITSYPRGGIEYVVCTRDRYESTDYPEPRIARGDS